MIKGQSGLHHLARSWFEIDVVIAAAIPKKCRNISRKVVYTKIPYFYLFMAFTMVEYS